MRPWWPARPFWQTARVSGKHDGDQPWSAGEDRDSSGKGKIGKSCKAWALVLGGMILVGVVNVVIAFRMKPAGFDENWRHADAAPAVVSKSKASHQPDSLGPSFRRRNAVSGSWWYRVARGSCSPWPSSRPLLATGWFGR